MTKTLRIGLTLCVFLSLIFFKSFAQNCTINAGSDRTICPGDAFVLTGNINGSVDQQPVWTQIAGPSVTVSATTNAGGTVTANVTGYSKGQAYTFRLSSRCTDGSAVFDDAVYTVSNLTVANAGPNIVACPGVVTMAANALQPGETGVWTVSGNLPLPNPVTSPNGQITLPTTGPTVGTSVYTWTITNSTGSCSSSSSVSVTNLGGEPIFADSPINVSCYSVNAIARLHASFAGIGNGQQGTWSFISGPSVPTFGDVHDNNTGVGGLVAGVYKIRWTVAGQCVNGIADVTINVANPSQDVTDAGGEPYFTYCDGRSSTVLNGAKPRFTNEVVQWTSASTNPAGVSITNPTSPTTTINGMDGHSAYDFIYTITNTVTGCSNTGIYHVRYTTAPSITFLTPNPAILPCDANQLTVNYNVAGGNRTQWALVSAPAGSQLQANAGINNFTTAADNLQPIVGMNKIGTYVIRFRRYNDDASGGCSDAFQDITIVVSKSPYQANAGTSQYLACGTTSATLAGNAPLADDAGNGQWTQVSGPNTATIANRSLNNTGISNLQSGVYTFRWIVTGGGADCGNSQSDVQVVIASAPTHINAGASFTSCYNTPVKLNADPPAANEKGTWSVVSESPATPASNITFSNVNDPNAIVSGLQANKTYVLQWRIENACGSLTANLTITTNSTAGPKQAVAGADQCLASGTTSFKLNANAPDAGETGIWTLLTGSPNTPAYTNANSQTVTGAVNGTYRFEWQLTKGGCITTRDTVVVTISPPTTQAQINGGTTSLDVCGLDPLTLNATNAPLQSGEIGTWTQTGGPGGAVINSPNGSSTTISGLTEGRYKFRYIITNSACSSSFAEISLNLSAPPTAAVAAVGGINPIQLCDATSTALDANTITVGQGLWVVKSGPNSPAFSSLNDPKATISGLTLGTYVLTWQSTNGTTCPASTSDVSIIVHQSANAGADQSLCNTNATVLTGNEGSDGTWTMVSALPVGTPPVTITKNGSSTGFGNSAIATGLTPGATYVFRYTINTGIVGGRDAGGCGTLTDDMTVYVSGPPSTADAGPDQQICTSTTTSVTLAAVQPTVGTGGWSIISRPTGSVATLSSPASNNAVLNNLTVAGDYLLQWTVSYANCQGDQSSNDIVRISVYDPPTVAQPMTDQLNACVGGVTLTGTTPTVGIGTWTFIPNSASDTRTPVIDAPNAPATTISNLVVDPANPYHFRWTISNGICNSSSADVNVTVKDQAPAVANAGTVNNVCTTPSAATASVTLASTNTNLTGNDQGTWTVSAQPASSPAVTFSDVHSPTATASGLVVGPYTFTWTIANNSECTSSSDVSFSVLQSPSQADAGPATASYCLSNPVVLSAVAPTIGTGTWTVIYKPSGAADPVFSSVNANNATVTNLIVGTYIFRWTVSNGTCTDTFDDITITTTNCNADLSISNSDGKSEYIPGTSNIYTIVATNTGNSDANGATLTYPFPAGTTGSWTATFAGGATGTASGTGSINENVNIPVGATITYVVTLDVPVTQTGSLSTTATISAPAGITDPTPANNTATDVDVFTSTADLSITNTDGKTEYIPGTNNTYTVVATNSGAIGVNGATVTYPFPAGTTGSWAATYTGGATGTASGTGNINQTVNLPAGATATYTVTLNVPATQTGNLSTTATITTPAGVTDPTPANNTATDVDALTTNADLSVTNTDGKADYVPGTTNTYTVAATNNSAINVNGATVSYPFPAGTTGTWTATFTDGATGTASGTGDINQTVNLPAGATATYTVTLNVPATQTGNLTTTATIAAPAGITDPTPANNSAKDVDVLTNTADLSITNSDGKPNYVPGTTNTYTVVATNSGAINVSGANVSYPLPAGTTGSWTATFTGGATGTTSGTGDISEAVNLPAGATATYTVTLNIPATQTGNLTTTAMITAPAGITDSTPANNSATDVDALNNSVDLSVLKTVSNPSASVNTNVDFTITATNNGPLTAANVTVTDLLPTGYTFVSATPSAGTYNNANGIWTVGSLTNGGSAVLTVTATVRPSGNYTNRATIASSNTEANAANNASQVTVAAQALPVANTDAAATPSNTPVQINLLSNDTQNASNLVPGSVTVTTAPQHGTVTIDTNTGIATYTPVAGYTGPDTFRYTVKDANGGTSNPAIVNVTVTAPPIANNDTAVTGQNTPVVLALLGNDVGNGGTLDPASVTVVQQPQHGTVTINPTTGAATYTPINGYSGPDNFTYTVKNSNGGTSNVATATITINKAPQANDDSSVTQQNTPVNIPLLTNDVNGDGALVPSTVTVVQQAQHGTVAINPATGAATYTPNNGYTGTDNFTYTVADQKGTVSNVANVTVTIPQSPVAVNDASATTPNTPVGIDILANDTPGAAAIDPTTLTIIAQPAHGSVIVDASTGRVTYVPATNYTGTDQFTYTIKDQNGVVSNVATVTVGIADKPVIGLAKTVSATTRAINGSYDVTYVLTVGNYGITDLTNISIKDDLTQTFTGEQVQVKSIRTLGRLQVNSNYNGASNTEMLASGNPLIRGQVEQIEVVANVTVLTGGATYLNRAFATGTSVTGAVTTDQSTDGLRPDETGSGDVSASTPTPVQLSKPTVTIPEGFSPNGDGVHDRFVIENVSGRHISLEFYNRWGNLVYRNANYQNDWDGKCNQGIHIGENLPEGTYYYIVRVEDKDKYVGFITLNR